MNAQCHHCSQLYKISEADIGGTASCEACGKDFVIAPVEAPEPPPPQDIPAPTVPCPYCGEQILAAAKKCKHCGEFLDGKEHADTTEESLVHVWLRKKKWMLASLLVPVTFIATLSLTGVASTGNAKQATVWAWQEFQNADYQTRNTLHQPYSERLSQQAYLYASIDLRDVDPLLQNHIRNATAHLKEAVSLYAEVEAQYAQIQQGVELATGVGALLGAASGDGYNSQGNAALGAALFGLIGAAAQENKTKEIQNHYQARLQAVADMLKADADADEIIAKRLSAKYKTPFIDAF